MPIIFFGHGNPMNALIDNEYSRGWAAAGDPQPADSHYQIGKRPAPLRDEGVLIIGSGS